MVYDLKKKKKQYTYFGQILQFHTKRNFTDV